MDSLGVVVDLVGSYADISGLVIGAPLIIDDIRG